MSEPDFSGIDPLRVPEARRRIAVLERYLALPDPTTADAVSFGEEIGLSRWQLQRLAAVWRDHRDPNLIIVGRRKTKPKRDYGIAKRAIEIANGVIAQAAADASVSSIASIIEARCVDENVAPPSRPTVYTYVRKARTAAPASGPPRIVIGRMWFQIPISDQPAETMPTLLAAIMLPEGVVIAHQLSIDAMEPPSISDMVDEVAAMRTTGAKKRAVVMNETDRRAAAAALARTDIASVTGHGQAAQSELARSLGSRLGPLDVILHRAKARPAKRKAATRFDEPLAPADVVAVIEGAIASNNAAAPASAPAFDIATD